MSRNVDKSDRVISALKPDTKTSPGLPGPKTFFTIDNASFERSGNSNDFCFSNSFLDFSSCSAFFFFRASFFFSSKLINRSLSSCKGSMVSFHFLIQSESSNGWYFGSSLFLTVVLLTLCVKTSLSSSRHSFVRSTNDVFEIECLCHDGVTFGDIMEDVPRDELNEVSWESFENCCLNLDSVVKSITGVFNALDFLINTGEVKIESTDISRGELLLCDRSFSLATIEFEYSGSETFV